MHNITIPAAQVQTWLKKFTGGWWYLSLLVLWPKHVAAVSPDKLLQVSEGSLLHNLMSYFYVLTVYHCNGMGLHYGQLRMQSEIAWTSAQLSRDKASVLGSSGQGSMGPLQFQAAAALWIPFFPSVGRPTTDFGATTSPVPPRVLVGRIDELLFNDSRQRGKSFSWVVTIINKPDRLLNMAILVGMFSWIKCHVSRTEKWFCVQHVVSWSVWSTSHSSGSS